MLIEKEVWKILLFAGYIKLIKKYESKNLLTMRPITRIIK